MKQDTLIVAEVFYSLQGEGATIGTPAVFLRLGGCNLLCQSKHWRCDTIEVWQKGRARVFDFVIPPSYVTHLKNGAHLVITGGEPLLQQDMLIKYLNWFAGYYHFVPTIEIETNGTIQPNGFMLNKVDYWNVSPKLSNSGEPYERRVNEVALQAIEDFGRQSIFKFVVSKNEDVLEILQDFKVRFNKVYLMPAGDNVSSLFKVRLAVAELCKEYGFKFTDRLHISLWNQKTGV